MDRVKLAEPQSGAAIAPYMLPRLVHVVECNRLACGVHELLLLADSASETQCISNMSSLSEVQLVLFPYLLAHLNAPHHNGSGCRCRFTACKPMGISGTASHSCTLTLRPRELCCTATVAVQTWSGASPPWDSNHHAAATERTPHELDHSNRLLHLNPYRAPRTQVIYMKAFKARWLVYLARRNARVGTARKQGATRA